MLTAFTNGNAERPFGMLDSRSAQARICRRWHTFWFGNPNQHPKPIRGLGGCSIQGVAAGRNSRRHSARACVEATSRFRADAAIAAERRVDFQAVLTEFATERFLYRLGASAHASRFVLKGATLLTLWQLDRRRATRDIDLHAPSWASVQEILAVIREILRAPAADAMLGVARIPMQIDVGFGDVILPRYARYARTESVASRSISVVNASSGIRLHISRNVSPVRSGGGAAPTMFS